MIQHPKWLDTACFYEVYPQSFFDSNNDGVGDINGIAEKLDYIKDLGFDALWINPIYLSPFYDAGYDVTDFKKVAPRYGTNQDLYNLFKLAHKKDMHVLLDLVPGHTAIDCPWFEKSCKAKKNAYTDRYIWTDNVWTSPKDLPVLRGFSERDGSVVTNFFSIQPALNYGFADPKEPYEQKIEDEGPQSTIKAMIDIILFWLRKGCDGFRCDMAGWLVKHDIDQEGTVRVWKQIINTVKQDFPESAFVSEWNNPEKSLKAGFDMDFLLQDEFNPYNSVLARTDKPYFRFDEEKKDAKIFFEHFKDVLSVAKDENKFVSLISGNHDTKRISSWLSMEELKFYYAFMFTSPNVPFLYYGDEIGMKFEENLQNVEGGYKRTGTRSPMQWDSNRNAGFSTTQKKLYIPINPDRQGISVEEEKKDDDSLYHFLKSILAFKREHHALDNDADYELIKTTGYSPLVYTRAKDGEKLLIAINVSNRKYSISYNGFKGNTLFYKGDAGLDTQKARIRLAPHSLIIIE